MNKKLFVMLLVTSCTLEAGPGAPPPSGISKETARRLERSAKDGLLVGLGTLVMKAGCILFQDTTPVCAVLPDGYTIVPFALAVGTIVSSTQWWRSQPRKKVLGKKKNI